MKKTNSLIVSAAVAAVAAVAFLVSAPVGHHPAAVSAVSVPAPTYTPSDSTGWD
ncbi:hypothetical protein [Streptacidiphilus albus]|uniref:hypothetical protein n=1 Tax=Streptacidiphilus albus TaxID=105425 RepID=UPI000AED362C|nr:hypothetical protein [Streptacidiphilus albus]